MSLENEVVYAVVYEIDGDGFLFHVPDLEGCFSWAKDLDELVQRAKEVITLQLCDLETPPAPTSLGEIRKTLANNQNLLAVSLWLPYQMAQVREVYKKKTLTVPVWLDALATAKNINFSQVLQKALKEELNIKH